MTDATRYRTGGEMHTTEGNRVLAAGRRYGAESGGQAAGTDGTLPRRRMFTTDRYTSQEFLEREKQHIFRKTWLVAARESDVPRPGDCLAVDVVDSRLVLVRGDDGLVRAFHNTCRHRGTQLVARRCAAAQIT